MDLENLPSFCELRKNHKLKLKLGFYAAPSNLKIFSKAIKDEFNKLKFTYCSELNGLIMEFGRISSYELIPADFRHCINVALNVDVYIFRPPVGSILEAVVNQTSDNHISCLVHNLFNVSVVRPEDQPYDQWPGSKIKKEDIINVRVLSFDLTKKLPHITGDIVNKNDRCCKPENDNYSSQYSSTEKSVEGPKKDSTSLTKYSSNESELSDKMQITTSSLKNDNKIKMSPICKKTSINNRENIKSQLYSSTPISNSELELVNGNTVIRIKPFEQLKNSPGKFSIEQSQKYEKNDDSNAKHNLNVSSQEQVKQDLKKEEALNTSEDDVINMPNFSEEIANIVSRAIYNSERISSYEILPVKDLDQKKNVNHEPEINKQLDLTKSKICKTDSDNQSSSDDDNYIKLKQSTSKQDDKKLKLDNSVNGHSSNLITKKRKTSQSNDNKDCKNQIKNKVVQRHSSSTSDSDSSSNENITLPVKVLDPKKNVNHEPEISKQLDLTKSKICQTDSDDQSSSDDDNYTKFKYNTSKQDDTKPDCDDKKLKLDNSVNVHSSTLTKKRKTFQSNDNKDCKNQIKNKVIQRHSSSTSDSDSSSNENITLPVKVLDQKKNVNHEPEISKQLDLTKSKICQTDSDDQSSSDDDNYIKLKQSTSKQDDKKLKLDNSVNGHSSNLITKKRKTFQSNDNKDCKNQIKNKVIQRHSSSTSDSDSSSNENITLPVKVLDQKKNVNHEPEISKQLDLTKSKICQTDSDDQSSSDDDNYTKFKYNTSKQDDTKPDCDDKKLKLDNSVNVHSSTLTKKRKTFQSNDNKDCKNQIKNKVVQRHSSSTSDSDSSSNENIILPVKVLDQKKNVNHEPEISKQLDLTKSKICQTDSDDQSSSDDDNYTKFKYNTSKQDDTKPDCDDKKLKLDNSVNVHSSTLTKKRKTFQSNDNKDCKNQIKNKVVQRHSSSTSDSDSSSNETQNTNTKKHCFKMAEINTNKIHEFSFAKKPKKNKKQKRKKCTLLKSPKDNKSIKNLMKIRNNKDKLINTILEEDCSSNFSSSGVSTDNDIEFIKKYGEKQRLNKIKNAEVQEVSTKNDTSNKQKKTIEKSDDKVTKSQNETFLPVKVLDQKKNVNHEPEINKQLDLTKSKICKTDSDDQSSSDDDNYIKLKQSTSKQDDKKLKLDNSVNGHSSNLITKKRKIFQSNDNKDCKNQIKNNVVQRHSSSTSDSDSSSNENIILPVKVLDQKKNVNHEPEINKCINSNKKKHCFNMAEKNTNKIHEFSIAKKPKNKKKQKLKKCTLLKSPKDNKLLKNLMKIMNNKDKLINTILEEDCSSSSVSTDNDIEFIKKCVEKQRLNKIKNAEVPKVSTKNDTSNKQKKAIEKSDDKITKSQNETFVTTKIKEHLINVAEIDKNKISTLSNEKTPKSNKKQGNKKCTPLKSPKDNKSLRNLMKTTNNKDKIIKTILEEDSNGVSTDDDIEFIKKTEEKQRLNKIKKTKVPEVSSKNNTTNIQRKTIKKLDDKIKKPQIATDELSSRKRKRSKELTKELLLDRVLNSLQDSSSCHSPTKKKRKFHNSMIKTNDISTHINYDKSSSKVKRKIKS